MSFSICILVSAPAIAEPQKLTLRQIVEVSLQNNGDLKSFREEKGVHEAGKIRAGLLPNPTIEIEAGTGALTGSTNENSLLLGISQEFLLAGKREKRLASAEHELDSYRWQVADRERQLRAEVKTVFYDVILAEQRINLADRYTQLNRQLLDVAKERLAAGDIPELEMNLVRVELARSEGTRIAVEKALNQNHFRLWTLMGLSPGESPPISGAFASELNLTKNLGELKQLSQLLRADLKALEAEKNRGEADSILARAERTPNVTAGLVLRRDTASMEINGFEGKETAYTIGVRLSMPIPLFDNNKAGIQEVEAKRSGSESRLRTAARNAELEVETAYADLLNAEKIRSLYKADIIPQMEENLALTQEAYRLGEVGILAVIQEQKKFYEVSDGYLLALHDRQAALVKLEAATATDLSGGVQ